LGKSGEKGVVLRALIDKKTMFLRRGGAVGLGIKVYIFVNGLHST